MLTIFKLFVFDYALAPIPVDFEFFTWYFSVTVVTKRTGVFLAITN